MSHELFPFCQDRTNPFVKEPELALAATIERMSASACFVENSFRRTGCPGMPLPVGSFAQSARTRWDGRWPPRGRHTPELRGPVLLPPLAAPCRPEGSFVNLLAADARRNDLQRVPSSARPPLPGSL